MNPMHFVVKFNKSLNMKNLFVCTITSENNNEQYLVSYLMLPFWEFFYKRTCMLRRSSYIYISLRGECRKTSFTRCFIVTVENFI